MTELNWTLEANDLVYEFVIEFELIPGERPCKTHNGVGHEVKRFFAKCVKIIGEDEETVPVGNHIIALNGWMQRDYSEQIENYILDKVGPPV